MALREPRRRGRRDKYRSSTVASRARSWDRRIVTKAEVGRETRRTGRSSRSQRWPANDRNRRNLVIAGRSSEGRLTEPTPAVQPRRRERLKVPRSRHSTVQSGLYFAAILIAHLLGSRELLPGLARLWMWISLLSPHRKAASQLLMEQVSFGGSERVLQARFEARKQIAERPLGANRG
jgi:hypothetical protein